MDDRSGGDWTGAQVHLLARTAGAEFWGVRPTGPNEWSFALWAPSCPEIMLELEGATLPMQRGEDGVHRLRARAPEGAVYRFRAGDLRFADPASVHQWGGVEGHSVLRDLRRLADRSARRVPTPFARQVIAEVHVGSFTPAGTFAAAARAPELRRLADLGVTAIELMPLGQFPGTRGWGYDSVLPYAPQDSYGGPEDLAGLIDTAHGLGLSVYLDVVFNHFGPKGNVLSKICPEFFRDEENDWGQKIDYTRPAVRAFFLDCARHWLRDYHFDGLRFDAIHEMEDLSAPPIEEELPRTLRAEFPHVHLVAEDCRNGTALYEPAQGLYDANWDDDYHHALHVLLTGESFGYYADYTPQPLQDLALALRDGQAMQGQVRPDGCTAKGQPSAHLPASAFVNFNLNHDHAGNRPRGERLVSLVGSARAQVAHALLLTAPYVPLLFMGEECGSRAPFPWFGDYGGSAAQKMLEGRREQFGDLPGGGRDMLDPFDPATAGLAHPYAEAAPDQDSWLNLTQHLLDLRRRVLLPLFDSGRAAATRVAVIGPQALTVDWVFHAGCLRAVAGFGGAGFGAAGTKPATAGPAGASQPLCQIGDGDGPWFRLWLTEAAPS
ncbi:alpha-amylase family glycosyl hydrolase [Tabrizicola aquatica]|uniref:alpha-amylase family glycosyl hydrolase n=1 Tax=Tabrizicola aquatica TaxID=909926 RepID=UPI000CD2EDE7|nr:alpha-amylase family glycosyl hydrolase [Tabrizicola aquatica]